MLIQGGYLRRKEYTKCYLPTHQTSTIYCKRSWNLLLRDIPLSGPIEYHLQNLNSKRVQKGVGNIPWWHWPVWKHNISQIMSIILCKYLKMLYTITQNINQVRVKHRRILLFSSAILCIIKSLCMKILFSTACSCYHSIYAKSQGTDRKIELISLSGFMCHRLRPKIKSSRSWYKMNRDQRAWSNSIKVRLSSITYLSACHYK